MGTGELPAVPGHQGHMASGNTNGMCRISMEADAQGKIMAPFEEGGVLLSVPAGSSERVESVKHIREQFENEPDQDS